MQILVQVFSIDVFLEIWGLPSLPGTERETPLQKESSLINVNVSYESNF